MCRTHGKHTGIITAHTHYLIYILTHHWQAKDVDQFLAEFGEEHEPKPKPRRRSSAGTAAAIAAAAAATTYAASVHSKKSDDTEKALSSGSTETTMTSRFPIQISAPSPKGDGEGFRGDSIIVVNSNTENLSSSSREALSTRQHVVSSLEFQQQLPSQRLFQRGAVDHEMKVKNLRMQQKQLQLQEQQLELEMQQQQLVAQMRQYDTSPGLALQRTLMGQGRSVEGYSEDLRAITAISRAQNSDSLTLQSPSRRLSLKTTSARPAQYARAPKDADEADCEPDIHNVELPTGKARHPTAQSSLMVPGIESLERHGGGPGVTLFHTADM